MRHKDRTFVVEGREVILSTHAVDRYRLRTGDHLARRLPDRMAREARWSDRRPEWDSSGLNEPGLHFVGCVRLGEDQVFPCGLKFNDDTGLLTIIAGTFLTREGAMAR